MPDRWRETRVRKVLRPAISIQVFLVSLWLLSKCWDGSPVSKLSLHASHVALPKYILVSERLHVCCIRVRNLCHRVPTQLQLNKYYYYYYYCLVLPSRFFPWGFPRKILNASRPIRATCIAVIILLHLVRNVHENLISLYNLPKINKHITSSVYDCTVADVEKHSRHLVVDITFP